jgi:hypothetical protein
MNGHSGEFGHLLNHRRITAANASMASFETGLRSYENRRAKSKAEPEDPQSPSKDQAKPKFQVLPMIDRGEYPYYLVTAKELDLYKKKSPIYSNERLVQQSKSPGAKVKVLAM